MKFSILILSILLSSTSVAHDSIGIEDLVGAWDSVGQSEEWIPSMVITEGGEIAFTRTTIHTTGHELQIRCLSELEKVQLIEGVFIIPCSNTKVSGGNIVFSGRTSGGITKIVGLFYQLYDGTLNNTVPLSLVRRGAADNKSLNADASDAGAG